MGTDALGIGEITYTNKTKRVLHSVTEEETALQAWTDGDHVVHWDWKAYETLKRIDVV